MHKELSNPTAVKHSKNGFNRYTVALFEQRIEVDKDSTDSKFFYKEEIGAGWGEQLQ